jgi:hypothetical protein
MSHDTSLKRATDATSDTEAGRLDETVREIGVARFVGRINSGVIDATGGYRAVERFANEQSERSLLSRVTHMLLGRKDTFDPR